MEEYDIPVENIVRHYDISGKLCPGIIGWNTDSGDESAWLSFKSRMEDENMTQEKFNQMMNNYLAELAKKEGSAWSAADREWAIKNGIFAGDGTGQYQWQSFVTREQLAAIEHRMANKK